MRRAVREQSWPGQRELKRICPGASELWKRLSRLQRRLRLHSARRPPSHRLENGPDALQPGRARAGLPEHRGSLTPRTPGNRRQTLQGRRPAATGVRLAPGARPAPSLPARARSAPTRPPAPSLLPPAPRSLARSLAGSSSLARPRPAQLGQSDRGAERASSGGPGGCPGPRPLPAAASLPSRSPPPSFPGSRAVRPPRSPRPERPVTDARDRPAAAGPGGIALLLALLLGSLAAAPAGGAPGGGAGRGQSCREYRAAAGWRVGSSWLIQRTRPHRLGCGAGGGCHIRGWAHVSPFGPCCWECGGGDVSEGLGRSPASAAGSLPAALAPGSPLQSQRVSLEGSPP